MTGPNSLNLSLQQLGCDSHLLNKEQIAAFAEDKPCQRLPDSEVHFISSRSLYFPRTKHSMERFPPISGPAWAPSLFPLTCRMSLNSIHLYDEAPPFPYRSPTSCPGDDCIAQRACGSAGKDSQLCFSSGHKPCACKGPMIIRSSPFPTHTTQVSPLLHSQG